MQNLFGLELQGLQSQIILFIVKNYSIQIRNHFISFRSRFDWNFPYLPFSLIQISSNRNYCFPLTIIQNVSTIGWGPILDGTDSPLAMQLSLCPSYKIANGILESFQMATGKTWLIKVNAWVIHNKGNTCLCTDCLHSFPFSNSQTNNTILCHWLWNPAQGKSTQFLWSDIWWFHHMVNERGLGTHKRCYSGVRPNLITVKCHNSWTRSLEV